MTRLEAGLHGNWLSYSPSLDLHQPCIGWPSIQTQACCAHRLTTCECGSMHTPSAAHAVCTDSAPMHEMPRPGAIMRYTRREPHDLHSSTQQSVTDICSMCLRPRHQRLCTATMACSAERPAQWKTTLRARSALRVSTANREPSEGAGAGVPGEASPALRGLVAPAVLGLGTSPAQGALSKLAHLIAAQYTAANQIKTMFCSCSRVCGECETVKPSILTQSTNRRALLP